MKYLNLKRGNRPTWVDGRFLKILREGNFNLLGLVPKIVTHATFRRIS